MYFTGYRGRKPPCKDQNSCTAIGSSGPTTMASRTLEQAASLTLPADIGRALVPVGVLKGGTEPTVTDQRRRSPCN